MSLRSVLPRVKTGLEVGGGGDSFLGRGKKGAELFSCPYLLSFRPPPARPLAAHIGLLPGAGKGTETRKAVLNLIQWQPSFTGFVSLPAMERYERRREGGKARKNAHTKKSVAAGMARSALPTRFLQQKREGTGKGKPPQHLLRLPLPRTLVSETFSSFFWCVCVSVCRVSLPRCS